MLARALSTAPSLLLLDGPFTGVDAPTQTMLTDLYRSLTAEGMTILMSTHDMYSAATSCSRIIGVRGGIDLFNPNLAFLPRALAAVVISSLVTGVVGCHVVMCGMVFIGDAVAHSVFPGLAVAFVVGGLLAGVLTAILVAIFSQNQKLREDSVIGIFFAGAFALGIVIISLAPGYSGSVQDFLFGSIVGIPGNDVLVSACVALVILALLGLFHRHIVTVSLDRESARAAGLPVLWIDIALYVLVTISVVISLKTLGNVLVLALIVIPPSAARLACSRLGTMMIFAPVFGCLCSTTGLYLSWAFNLPVGGTIVLTMIAGFLGTVLTREGTALFQKREYKHTLKT